jgi:hypothetical protein
MVQTCFAIKDWIKYFGISLKGHSVFRAFSLLQETNIGNVSLFYKQSSLDQSWIGLQDNSLLGILIFESFPEVDDGPDQIQPLELDIVLINKLLHTNSITEHLDIHNKEYYLQLQSNTKCFLVSVEKQSFLSYGTYYDNYISTIVAPPNITTFIDIDVIQQHLLRYGVVSEDIGSMVFADMKCGDWNFTLAEITEVGDLTITIIPWIQQIYNLDFEWQRMDSLKCEILKSLIIAKEVHLTQKNILKKKWKNFLKNHYDF